MGVNSGMFLNHSKNESIVFIFPYFMWGACYKDPLHALLFSHWATQISSQQTLPAQQLHWVNCIRGEFAKLIVCKAS